MNIGTFVQFFFGIVEITIKTCQKSLKAICMNFILLKKENTK